MAASDFDELMRYQNLMQKRLKKESKIDKKIELMSIINQLTTGPGNLVQKENIILEASSRGFSNNEIENYLIDLINSNIIFESSPGYIKKRR
ncbi:hypothetical protein HOD20_06335 [archaeon]|jgi:hypothetical protein|nr:hypothetical protein [archaeon]MBT4352120.1 hypothetical protein [archaeon]MBT4648437.1 hypothetical protein [archaeon]MBT6821755.1 hypothetical protein [archaeon]MBT7391215.1 hypothetical protein [archaeon]